MNRTCLSTRFVAICCAAALFCGRSAADELRLVHDGQAEAVIVVADTPLPACNSEMGGVSGTQRTAAETLQKYLEKASGVRLPIVSASEAPETGTLVLVGRSTVSDRHRLALPTKPEGLRIQSFERGIALLGEIAKADSPANNAETDTDRGVFHAVYAFLEREIGFRFYLSVPDDEELGIVIPRKPTLSVRLPIAYEDAPAFSLRQNYGLGHLGASRAGAADRFQVNHTHFGWRDLYQQSHPEFFALSRLPSPRDRVRLAMGEAAVTAARQFDIEQRRLLWMRRFFEVCEIGDYGLYASPAGPLALARTAQRWFGAIPKQTVARVHEPPPFDLSAPAWRQAPPAHLIQGGPRPGNADTNVGFVADLPTEVRVLQDADSLHVAFRCFQWLPPRAKQDEVALTLYGNEDRPLLSIAVDPDGGRKGTDDPRVLTRTSTRFPPLRVVRVPPSQAVNFETGDDAAGRTREAGHNLFAGQWTGTHTRIASYGALLRFELPTLAPNESIPRATFQGYVEGQLNEVYVTGVGISYSSEDDWDAESAVLARKPTLLEPDYVLGAGNNGGNAKVWVTSNATRHLRRPGERPGKPLTLGLTSSGHSGVRGLALAGLERGELAPYLQLEIGEVDLAAPPSWDAFITIPKEALGDGPARGLRVELARRHDGRDYRWSPPLAYLWEYRDPPARRGRLTLE